LTIFFQYNPPVIPVKDLIKISFYIFFFSAINIRLSYAQLIDPGIDLGGDSYSYCMWGDYDNDGDLDILLSGYYARILKNNGDRTFTDINAPFYDAGYAYAGTWIDYDKDNDLDVFHGERLLENKGSDIFTEVFIEDMKEFNSRDNFDYIDVFDYDNDGDEDMILEYQGKILIMNNRGGKFLLVDQDLIAGEHIGGKTNNVKWIDVDNNGFFDILSSELYKNNSNNLFINDTDFYINDRGYQVSVGDYNSDGFTDALYTERYSSVMLKNMDGTFSNAELLALQNASGSTVSAFGDFTNDGKLDFALMPGRMLFSNNGNDEFTVSEIAYSVSSLNDMEWGDFDNDGDLDLLMSGQVPKLFENTLNNSNSPPSVPSNLNTTIDGNSVLFTWDRSTDAETPVMGLSYNICVIIDTEQNEVIKLPMADLSSGYLSIPKTGNTGLNNFWKTGGLRMGPYKWTVQAIDNSYQGSAFAAFQTFQISSSSAISSTATQVLHPDESGIILTVRETIAVDSRQWVYSVFPGGPYNNLITGATGISYTPRFHDVGRYFIICRSIAGSDTISSNEVMVEVVPFTEAVISSISSYASGTIEPGDSDNDGDIDLLFTGDYGTRLYINTDNNYSLINITSGLVYSDAAWFDYNKDNKLDFIITGSVSGASDSEKQTRIFINQGSNSFSELTHDIIGLAYGSVDVGDFDHDGDPDILICGKDIDPLTKIYRNDNGSYIDIEAQVGQVTDGFAKWGDYDNDGDMDIFLSGTDFSGNPYSGIYRNDGVEGFKSLDYKFRPYKYSFGEFGDYDNDSDIDILLSGSATTGLNETLIYKNLGNDQFQEVSNIYTDNDVGYNYVKWFDYNNDGLLDILLAAEEYAGAFRSEKNTIHRILENSGNDVFKEISYKKAWVNLSQLITLADMDNDGDIDMLQSQGDRFLKSTYISAFYNESSTVKSLPPAPEGLTSTRRGKDIILSWNKAEEYTGVSYDIMIGTAPGLNDVVSPLSQIENGYRLVAQPGHISDTTCKITMPEKGTYYWKVQAINNSFKGSSFSETDTFDIGDYFTDRSNPFIPLRYDVTFDWGDYDNDGDQDLLLGGMYWVSPDWLYYTHVYENTGNGTFDASPVLDIVNKAEEIKWLDLDNDNDLDIALSGGGRFIIFDNQGSGNFSEVYNVMNSSEDFSYGDYNNDGFLDILFNRQLLLVNHGDFSFNELIVPFSCNTLYYSFNDLNNDLNKDIITLGDSLRIYKRNENDYQKYTLNIPALNHYYTDYDAGDLDNDGDIDILISGYTDDDMKMTIILRNDGNFKFTEISSFIRGTYYGSISLGDYDNDNDLDILLSGNSFSVITKIYENRGNFQFEEMDYPLVGQWQGRAGWSDFDEDGDLDVIVAGTSGVGVANSRLYQNNLDIPPETVIPPGSLESAKEGYGIILSWKDILNTGVSYNVRVGTQPGTCDIVSPMSDLSSGKRKVARIGNADINSKFKLDSLAVGTYYWSVQAVNHAFKGSMWAIEDSFLITMINAGFSSDTVCAGDSTHFTDETLTSGESITVWEWYFGDGESDTLSNPAHLYKESGNYVVTLVVKTDNYSDTIIKEVIVKPTAYPDFIVDIACQGTPSTFSNTSDNNGLTIVNWLWNFGDGLSSVSADPGTHGYLNAGEYVAELWAFTSNGCNSSARKTVTVGSVPVAVITASSSLSFCAGDSVILSAGSNTEYTYRWLLNGVGITNAVYPDYKATLTGNYSVEITNTKGNCKTISSPVTVTRLDMPAAPVIVTLNYTSGQCLSDNPITLSVDQPVTGYNYQWKRNGIPVNDATMSQLSGYLPEGDYSVVAGLSTCRTESAVKTIIYDEAPDKPLIHAEGPVVWYLACSNDSAAQYRWYYEGEQIPGAHNYICVANQELGEYYVSIANIRGCFTSSDIIKIPPDAIGVQDVDAFTGLKIYPNPTHGIFVIEMNNQIMGQVIIKIFDQTGKEIFNQKKIKMTYDFIIEADISRQGKGMFIVNVEIGKYSVAKSVILE